MSPAPFRHALITGMKAQQICVDFLVVKKRQPWADCSNSEDKGYLKLDGKKAEKSKDLLEACKVITGLVSGPRIWYTAQIVQFVL